MFTLVDPLPIYTDINTYYSLVRWLYLAWIFKIPRKKRASTIFSLQTFQHLSSPLSLCLFQFLETSAFFHLLPIPYAFWLLQMNVLCAHLVATLPKRDWLISANVYENLIRTLCIYVYTEYNILTIFYNETRKVLSQHPPLIHQCSFSSVGSFT